jgi:ferredoxin
MTYVIRALPFEEKTMKVSIYRDGCIGCGVCEALCPEVFKLLEDGKSSIVEKYRKGGPMKEKLKII